MFRHIDIYLQKIVCIVVASKRRVMLGCEVSFQIHQKERSSNCIPTSSSFLEPLSMPASGCSDHRTSSTSLLQSLLLLEHGFCKGFFGGHLSTSRVDSDGFCLLSDGLHDCWPWIPLDTLASRSDCTSEAGSGGQEQYQQQRKTKTTCSIKQLRTNLQPPPLSVMAWLRPL